MNKLKIAGIIITQLGRQAEAYRTIESEKKDYEYFWNHRSVLGTSPDGRR